MKISEILDYSEFRSFLDDAKTVKPLLIGDICTDIYWSCDMTKSRLSRETPHFPLPVVRERMSLGAGGNAAGCIRSLGVRDLSVIGVVRNDWRGDCLRRLLAERGISDDSVITEDTGFTNAYIKPMKFGFSGDEVESARLDFENEQPISPETEEKVIAELRRRSDDTDILIVCDQFGNGIITDRVIDEILSIAASGKPVVVDSRTRIDRFRGCILKPNEVECAAALGKTPERDAGVSEYARLAKELSEKLASSVCMTIGDKGSLVANGTAKLIPAVKTKPPFDIVGAGDCFLSAFSTAAAEGFPLEKAALFGNMASSIVVKKIGTTGSASPEELEAAYTEREVDSEKGIMDI